MTLIITVLTRKHVVQVSDRRITTIYPNGKTTVASDNGNKAIYVIGADCHFAVSYTGLARIADQPTDDWLSGKISSANTDFQPYERLKAVVEGPAITELKRFAQQPTGGRIDTTIVMAGFRASPGGETVSFIDPISTGPLRQLRIIRKPLEHVVVHGAINAISADVVRKVRALSDLRFFRRESGEVVAKEIVSLVREASDDAQHGKFIGRDCMELVVRPDPHIISCRRHVDETGKPPYPQPVTGSPIVVVSAWCLRFRTQDPKFTLNDLRIGDIDSNPPLKEGESSFKIVLPAKGGKPRREY